MNLTTLLLALPALLLFNTSTAQIKHAHTTTVEVDGNCGMCKKTIEAAAFVQREARAEWNVDTKVATITYDSTRTTADAVLKRIALAGYDNQAYRAPDPVYASLHGCCQYERTALHTSSEEADQHPGSVGHAHPAVAPTPTTEEVADPAKPVFDAYFALKNALVASDGAKAKELAKIWSAAMHTLDATKLPADQQATWAEVMTASMPSLHALAETADLEKQRVLFAKLAAPMVQLAKAVPQEAPIYVDHCPMYNGGADWLSQEKGIRNPYYGSSMMTCGSVKETITK